MDEGGARKELVAGFWLWQVKSMEEAIGWVKRCPNPIGWVLRSIVMAIFGRARR